jgi:DNA-binding NarL/FixJ family response regulator
MRVLIADNNSRIRYALRLVLVHNMGCQVAGEITDASELVEQVRQIRPDILIMDINLPGLHAGVRADAVSLLELVRTLRQVCPHLHIAALSSRPEDQGMCEKAGFDISILKNDPPDALINWLSRFKMDHQKKG